VLCSAAFGRALGTVRRLGSAGALAAAVVLGAPLVASARPDGLAHSAAQGRAAGVSYGGVTPQLFPVVIEVSKNRKRVVVASIGLRLACTSGGLVNLPDGYTNLRLTKKGKFGASFGPTTVRNDNGTTTDFEGRMSGKLNAARTKVSGKWKLKVTDHDASGAVIDTCDSGAVKWKAKQ
jgi:hypothetical protein